MVRPVNLVNLGVLDYASAWRWQVENAFAVRSRAGGETLAIVEHPPVYTFGRRPRPDHLLVGVDELRARGADVVESDRGGDVTFHGPGQLVVYPILHLRERGLGPVEYVRFLEETASRALWDFDIEGERVAGRPGVWVRGAKIASVGVRIQGGISTHGLALNVETDLAWFEAIVPCGIRGASVTSVERVLGSSPGVEAMANACVAAFEEVFGSAVSSHPSASPCAAFASADTRRGESLVRAHGR
jgi:lipoate-protein ligase B